MINSNNILKKLNLTRFQKKNYKIKFIFNYNNINLFIFLSKIILKLKLTIIIFIVEDIKLIKN